MRKPIIFLTIFSIVLAFFLVSRRTEAPLAPVSRGAPAAMASLPPPSLSLPQAGAELITTLPAVAEDLPPPLETPATRAQKIEDLPATEQASLQRAIFMSMHAVEPLTDAEAALPQNEGVSHFTTHSGQKFHARFLKDGGVRLGSSQVEKTWQGTLRVAPGKEAAAVLVPPRGEGSPVWTAPAGLSTRAERDAGGGITEWYENKAEGLEHGFTLAARPEDASEHGFTLDLVLDGLRVEKAGAEDGTGAEPAGRSSPLLSPGDLVFTDPETDEPVLGYTKLKVWDATGRELAARMSPTPAGLRFAVRDEEAVYPVTIDPLYINLQGKLTFPPNERKFSDASANAGEHFGHAVALNGNTALVGAPHKTVNGNARQGAVFVYARNASGAAWSLQATLTVNGLAGDEFGFAVALEGDTAVIGAPKRTVNGQTQAGEAYVFTRSGTSWTVQSVLFGAFPMALSDDHFGFSVALSGNTALVGTPGEGFTGAVKVFIRSGSSWFQQANLTIDNSFTRYGFSVALDGDVALIGAPGYSIDGSYDHGAAFVFSRIGTSWGARSLLTASDPQAAAYFGSSVALSGSTALIGSPGYATSLLLGSYYEPGAAYVFVRPGASLATWNQQAMLLPASGNHKDKFGESVALDGNTAVVCAPHHEVNGMGNQGAAYLYTRSGTTWTERRKVTGSEGGGGAQYKSWFSIQSGGGKTIALSGDTFVFGVPEHYADGVVQSGAAYLFEGLQNNHAGLSVALDGNVAVVGALDHDLAGAPSAGAAWILERSGTQWTTERKLVDSAPAAHDRFGVAVAISGSRVVVGADYDDVDGRTDCGSVSVFERTRLLTIFVWPRRYFFRGLEGGNLLGRSVAIDGAYVAAGAPGVNGGAGEVRAWWLYKLYQDSWDSLRTDIDSPAPQSGANFGFSVALSGGKLIVGSPGYNPASASTTYNNGGRVDFYTVYQSGANLVHGHAGNFTRYVTNAGLGFSVAIEGNVAVAGSTSPPGWFTGAGDSAQGMAAVFTHNGTAWGTNPFGAGAPVVLDNSGFSAGSFFGSSVAISSDVIAVGAHGGGNQQGFVRLFRRTGGAWVKEAQDIKAFVWDGGGPGDAFGISTALSGSTLLVGAHGIDAGSGAAFPYLLYDGSTPPVLNIRQRGANVDLTWPLGTGKALWRSPTMASGSWIKITGSENMTAYSYPANQGRMFFRLGPP